MSKKSMVFPLFCIYSGWMLGLLFIRQLPDISAADFSYWAHIRSHIHWIPFTTTREYLRILFCPSQYLSWMTADAYQSACRNAIVNLGGNTLLFIPLGFLLPRVFPRLQRFGSTLLCVAITISCVEILQLFTLLGYCDVDDLILNTLGAAIGYGIQALLDRQHIL